MGRQRSQKVKRLSLCAPLARSPHSQGAAPLRPRVPSDLASRRARASPVAGPPFPRQLSGERARALQLRANPGSSRAHPRASRPRAPPRPRPRAPCAPGPAPVAAPSPPNPAGRSEPTLRPGPAPALRAPPARPQPRPRGRPASLPPWPPRLSANAPLQPRPWPPHLLPTPPAPHAPRLHARGAPRHPRGRAAARWGRALGSGFGPPPAPA